MINHLSEQNNVLSLYMYITNHMLYMQFATDVENHNYGTAVFY